MIPYLKYIVFGYISGSVMYSYLIPKYFCKIDIMEISDDGNPGTANAMKCAGVFVGVLCLILDMMKGFIPVFFAATNLGMQKDLFALVMAAPVIGHAYPFFRKEKGGKSIAVSFGALLGLMPYYMPFMLLVVFYILFSTVVRLYPHSVRSISAFGLLSLGCLLFVENRAVVAGVFLLSAVVIYKHFIVRKEERAKAKMRIFRHKV